MTFAITLGLAACRGGPTPNPTAGFDVTIHQSGATHMVSIGADGTGCQSLGSLEAVCRLAVNQSPPVIGGAAFGRLNDQDTASFEALVWRARLDADPTVCERGGLLEPRLSTCHARAVDREYRSSAEAFEVEVPIGS